MGSHRDRSGKRITGKCKTVLRRWSRLADYDRDAWQHEARSATWLCYLGLRSIYLLGIGFPQVRATLPEALSPTCDCVGRLAALSLPVAGCPISGR